MQYLTNLARKLENSDRVLLSRQNNFGMYKEDSGYIIYDLVAGIHSWGYYQNIDRAYEMLSALYKDNPLVILCEPDGSLWHDTGYIHNIPKFMAQALEKFPSVEIMAVPSEF